MTGNEPPAGWYRDGSGRTRWWDGKQWTAPDHLFPEGSAATPGPDPEPEADATADGPSRRAPAQTRVDQPEEGTADEASRRWYKKKH